MYNRSLQQVEKSRTETLKYFPVFNQSIILTVSKRIAIKYTVMKNENFAWA
ncbi:spore coat protein F [Trichinella spiralis]|uniref:spore coat protein F n=1 Tax=Trichinella spiralis TaxID=6334 RepID=UPI0001EFB46E|nr:spore coat protein F [Trichinella spiralis]